MFFGRRIFHPYPLGVVMETFLFPMGQTVISLHALDALHPVDVILSLTRHASGDWGDLDEHDRNKNQVAARSKLAPLLGLQGPLWRQGFTSSPSMIAL